ncbi:MAG: ribose-phosphate pyrophosphokinase [Anaerolineales bacterium]|nr:ribose-phosphate pyrophosphokinase [Anaerolineales bacterium]MCX7755461.1 ribose-phosphate pyrophosphokinase [Anaerolineales bacterium]MDW8278882.1 ribose-phosphate pyrophosphokinase [Anaerolineales bacterium]
MSEHHINPGDVRFFCGQSHPALAQAIADDLGVPLEKSQFRRFSNDCMEVQLGASVRSRDVYIVQSLVRPVSEHLVELLIMLDIARSAGAASVHAILPYFSYARSDKKDAPRISITARLVADLLATAGATHVMTMTLHSPQVHGFFSVPTDVLTARTEFAAYFKHRKLEKTIVVSPDVGRAKSAVRFANMLGLPAVAAHKERLSDTQVKIGGLQARLLRKYRRALVYDDEIATGGSVFEVCKALAEGGIQEIIPICTHGVFTARALEQLAKIPQIVEIVTTDTVPPPVERPAFLTILPVAKIFGEAIWRNATRQSIGGLFSYWQEPEHL